MKEATMNLGVLPFAMVFIDTTSNAERGYEFSDAEKVYDPVTQSVPITTMGGVTTPTTYSLVGSTFMKDSDEGMDDKGTD